MRQHKNQHVSKYVIECKMSCTFNMPTLQNERKIVNDPTRI